MLEKSAYTTKEFEKALKIVIAEYANHIKPDNNPTVIIIGAQPGAGKSEVQKIAEKEYKNKLVICNADNFRRYHPRALELNREMPKEYPELTSNFAHEVNRGLQRHCLENNKSYILETTFRDADFINSSIKTYKESGFEVDIKVLAVQGNISRLHTVNRYEEMVKNEGVGRQVNKHAHDSRDAKVIETLKVVIDANLYDKIGVYKREIKIENEVHKISVVELSKNSKESFKEFKAEKQRPLSILEKQAYAQLSEETLSLMKERKASDNELQNFKIEFSAMLKNNQGQKNKF